MLTWHCITRNDYNNINADLKTSDKLFFIKDTNEFFCGEELFKDYIITYNTDNPTTSLLGRMYVHAYTLAGKIFDGNSWIDIISPVIDNKITNYINDSEIGVVEYDSVSDVILITFIDGTTDIIKMDHLVLDLLYGKSTGEFVIDYISAKLLNHNKKINLNNFIDIIKYDDINNRLCIKFKNTESVMNITIDGCIEDSAEDIIYISITGNRFIAECVLASNEDNLIIDNGNLFIVSKNNYTIVTEDSTNENIIGNSDYITEVVISNMIAILQSTYSEYNFSVGSGHEGEIIVANSSGIPIASGKKIGGYSLSNEPSHDLVATEGAIVEFVKENTIPVERIVHYTELAEDPNNASDMDILSEKAFVESIKWNIL